MLTYISRIYDTNMDTFIYILYLLHLVLLMIERKHGPKIKHRWPPYVEIARVD